MATIVAASNSYTDVNTAVNTTADRNDTVQIPAGDGTVTWTSTLSLIQGVILQGPGRDSLIITRSGGPAFDVTPDATAIANEEIISIEGVTVDGGGSSLTCVEGSGAGPSDAKPFKKLIIKNCKFQNNSNSTGSNGVISTTGQFRGVIAGNIFDRCNVILKILGNDNLTEWLNGNFPQSYGTADNLYFEDNAVLWSTSYSGGDPGWTETGQGSRLVIRYNTWNQANAIDATEVWDIHGFQNWGSEGQTGTMVVEYYGNTLTNIGTYRVLNHRGGWGLFFNNIITGSQIGSLEVNQYAPGDTGGSGCTVDVPGASGHILCEINNTYCWNNTGNGSIVDITPGEIGDGCGISDGNGYWNYNSGFTNGSNGIGRGTSAPTTTGNPDNSAYWVNATVTPSVDPDIVQAGHLYKRVGGVWVDYYTPYTYPHPLLGGEEPAATSQFGRFIMP